MEKEPIELKLCGIFNIIFGLITVVIYFFPFVFGVILGWGTDRGFYGKLDWFIQIIADPFIFAVTYVFAFLLIRSGILVLRIDPRGRKLAIISLIAVFISTALSFLTSFVREIAYRRTEVDFFSPLSIVYYIFYIYVFISIFYLVDIKIKYKFADGDVHIKFLWPVAIIILSLIAPLFSWRIIGFIVSSVSRLRGAGI